MKSLSVLLAQRQTLLQQARLANLAFTYETLRGFAVRIARARLQGEVNIKQAVPSEERFWASLTAIDFSQSVIEEHFTDEDVMELADLLGFVAGTDSLDATFRIEALAESFLEPLRQELERAGIAIDASEAPTDLMR